MVESLKPDYFERMFARNPDPWEFASSSYEAAKFDRTISILAGRSYQRALEVGCANGVLTNRFSAICRSLLSVDVSKTALKYAQLRNHGAPNVTFEAMTFPKTTPNGHFDLIVLSEVVYYWSAADIKLAGSWINDHATKCCDLLLVHWIGETNYPQTGDNAVNLLRAASPTVEVIEEGRTSKYRFDLWRIV